MKAILVVDVPVLYDGRHLCNGCPIWNDEHFFCEYDRNMNAKGCPLKPMPSKRKSMVEWVDANVKTHDLTEYDKGWNDCVEFLEGELND